MTKRRQTRTPAALAVARRFLARLETLTAAQLATLLADNKAAMAAHDAKQCNCTFHPVQSAGDWAMFDASAECLPRWTLAVALHSLVSFANEHPEASTSCGDCGGPLDG